VKDGKAGPDGPALLFDRDAWADFVAFAATFEV
jgi:hypothetical protein